jgi:hypothetical protein
MPIIKHFPNSPCHESHTQYSNNLQDFRSVIVLQSICLYEAPGYLFTIAVPTAQDVPFAEHCGSGASFWSFV